MLVLDRWPIELPSGLKLGPRVEMPLILENGLSVFRFDAHDTLGIVLSSVACKEGNGTFEFHTTPHPDMDATGRSLGLWRMDCALEVDSNDKLVSVTPEDAGEFDCRSVRSMSGDRRGALLFWSGIRVGSPTSPDTVLFVAQLVVLKEGDTCTEWLAWVGRERGTTASIEAMESPSINLRGPVSPRPGETHLAAQRRTRLLIPTSASFSVGMGNVPATFLLNGVNWPLYYWSAFDVKNALLHPNNQQQQFQAVYAADSKDVSSFRRLMYFATQDTTGHAKHFRHEGFQVAERGGPAGWYNWRAQYIPGYEDALSDAADKPRTRFGNTYMTPYPAVVGPMLARTDEFWFDVTEKYRSFVENSGMWEHRTVDDPDRGFLTHGAPVLGCNDRRGGPRATDYHRHVDFLETLRIVRKGLDRLHKGIPIFDAHFQNVRRDGLGGHPDYPIAEGIAPAMVALLRQAASEGISVSYYVQPYSVFLTEKWKDRLPPQARGYGRDGQPGGGRVFLPEALFELKGKPTQYVLDYGSPVAQTWFLDNLYGPLLEDFAMHNAYMDVFTGIGTAMFYDPPAPLEPTHVAHGGDYYMQGKRAFVTNVREFMKSLADRRGEDPRRYSISGEGAEEFLADRYDWVNVGYSYFGNHLMFAEDVALRWLAEYTQDPDPEDAFEGVPAVSRNMSPPLWNMVHHEWAPGQRTTGQWNNVGLSTNRFFYPTKHHISGAPDYSGIPPDRFVDLYCFTQALLVNEGVRPSQFIYYRNSDDRIRPQSSRLWILDDAGNVRIDPWIDPAGAGLKLRDFHAMLYEAMAEGPLREFVLYGRMERPLDVDDKDLNADLRTNPVFFVFGQQSSTEFVVATPSGPRRVLYGRFVDPGPAGQPKDLIVVGPYPTFQFDDSRYLTGFLDHPARPVQHSLWRGPDGTLGVILINWTSEDAQFSGILRVESYGLQPDAGVHARAYRGRNAVTGWTHLRGRRARITTDSAPSPGSLQIPTLLRRSLTVVLLKDARRPFLLQ